MTYAHFVPDIVHKCDAEHIINFSYITGLTEPDCVFLQCFFKISENRYLVSEKNISDCYIFLQCVQKYLKYKIK